MLLALFSDLHANREAVSACFAHAEASGARRKIFLGDYVGYGADPEWVLDALIDEVSRGAVALLGNHDAAVGDPREEMHGGAQRAIEWTRARLGPRHRAFLASLPLTLEEDGRLFVHASAAAPEEWEYVEGPEAVRRSFGATGFRITFCGHTHVPALYNQSRGNRLGAFAPVAGAPVPLSRLRRWIAVVGSVGQPRDGNPAACYALFDTEKDQITWQRVPYDVEAAMAKVRAAGLPESVAARLLVGR